MLLFVCLAPCGVAALVFTASQLAQMQNAYLGQSQRKRALCCSMLYYICLGLVITLLAGETIGLLILAGRAFTAR